MWERLAKRMAGEEDVWMKWLTETNDVPRDVLTLELDVAVHEPDTMHPANSFAKLAKHPSEERLLQTRV